MKYLKLFSSFFKKRVHIEKKETDRRAANPIFFKVGISKVKHRKARQLETLSNMKKFKTKPSKFLRYQSYYSTVKDVLQRLCLRRTDDIVDTS